jgi:hypothetical protein
MWVKSADLSSPAFLHLPHPCHSFHPRRRRTRVRLENEKHGTRQLLRNCFGQWLTSQVLHLANLASASLAMDNTDVPDWTWECGRVQHTWPTGHMFWIVGRKVPEM